MNPSTVIVGLFSIWMDVSNIPRDIQAFVFRFAPKQMFFLWMVFGYIVPKILVFMARNFETAIVHLYIRYTRFIRQRARKKKVMMMKMKMKRNIQGDEDGDVWDDAFTIGDLENDGMDEKIK